MRLTALSENRGVRRLAQLLGSLDRAIKMLDGRAGRMHPECPLASLRGIRERFLPYAG